jgi:dTDP-4-amino-4,6-dideoxy-D-galactose acyltransferase
MKINPLNWDTEFFGFPVASCELKEEDKIDFIRDSAINDGINLLYVVVPDCYYPHLYKQLEKLRAVKQDEKTTYIKRDIRYTELPIGVQIEEYQNGIPTPEMYELAIASGEYSRFHLDTRISENKFQEMYRLWIENSTKKQIADTVLVARIENTIVGLVTLKFKEKIGQIGIIAVASTVRGMGIGKQLMRAAENCCFQNGMDHMLVVTQAFNESACRLYDKAGFVVFKTEHIYHWWL